MKYNQRKKNWIKKDRIKSMKIELNQGKQN